MKDKTLRGVANYLGKPIQNYETTIDSILKPFKLPVHQLLDWNIPKAFIGVVAEPNVREIHKWAGNKKHEFVFTVETKNGWYRLATKRESEIFLGSGLKRGGREETKPNREVKIKKDVNERTGKTSKRTGTKNSSS